MIQSFETEVTSRVLDCTFLDCAHDLVCKVLEQPDLLIAENPDFGAAAEGGPQGTSGINYAAAARAGGNAENLNVLRVGWSGSASKRRAVATDRPEP
jgi:hypothetical protein